MFSVQGHSVTIQNSETSPDKGSGLFSVFHSVSCKLFKAYCIDCERRLTPNWSFEWSLVHSLCEPKILACVRTLCLELSSQCWGQKLSHMDCPQARVEFRQEKCTSGLNWKWVKFNNPHISGIELYRALKMKIPKRLNLPESKRYWDGNPFLNCHYWHTMQKR